MPKLSLSQAWDETRAVLARDGRLFIAVALALIVLPQTVIGLVAPRTGEEAASLTFALLAITIIIGFIAQVALNRLAIGPSTTVGAAIGRGFSRMPVLIGSFMILTIGLFVVLIPIIIVLGEMGLVAETNGGRDATAGLIAVILVIAALGYAIFFLTIPVSAVESGGSIHLVARAWHLGRPAYWRLLAFVVTVFFGLGVVAVAGQFGLGSIIALALGPPDALSLSALIISLVVALIQAVFTVIIAVMLARIYVQLNGTSHPSVPSSGT
jgi:hypothetical protein